MIIAIGGCSRSGKTTLAEALVWHYRNQNKTAVALHQDDFVQKLHDIPLIQGRTDWEIPVSIDFEKLSQTVSFYSAHFEVIIVEGLFAFANANLNKSYDYGLFVEISENTFRIRRTVSNRWGAEPAWFLDHVWNSFQKYGQPASLVLRVSGEKAYDLKTITEQLKPKSA